MILINAMKTFKKFLKEVEINISKICVEKKLSNKCHVVILSKVQSR